MRREHLLPAPERGALWADRLAHFTRRLDGHQALVVEGRLTRAVGLTLEAVGCQAAIGSRCDIETPDGEVVDAEVVGFGRDSLFLMPLGPSRGLKPNARVLPRHGSSAIAVGEDLLGRVLDGRGQPLDGRTAPYAEERTVLAGEQINPLQRRPIAEPLDVGIRSINGLLSVGQGQRLGLFAGSGVGKSVLLGMMTRFTSADVTVVGLIGERGREVAEFVESTLGEEGMRRAVIVAAPADDPPLLRLHGAWLATAIAEHFRRHGKNVLLLMDSLTRFAQAQREIGLAIGEPPATRGYPPSVFARIPQLVERAGNAEHDAGSITAFYTVLTEGDDQHDPIADASRAILDGHLVLSRELAEEGLYPAIDLEASVSRAMHQIVDPAHRACVAELRRLYAAYRRNRDLINIGAYQPGNDAEVDRAVSVWPAVRDYLGQDMHDRVDFSTSRAQLEALLAAPGAPA